LALINYSYNDIIEIKSKDTNGKKEFPSPILVGALFEKFLSLTEFIEETQ